MRYKRHATKTTIARNSRSGSRATASWRLPLAALAIGGAIASAAAIAYVGLRDSRFLSIDANDRAQIDTGRRLYAEACASCHGASLEGQTGWQRRLPNGRMPAPPHDASGHTWHHSDEVLFRITKDGPAAYPEGYQTDMLAFGHRLTDEEIVATLTFIKSTWPAEIRAKQARIDADARRKQR